MFISQSSIKKPPLYLKEAGSSAWTSVISRKIEKKSKLWFRSCRHTRTVCHVKLNAKHGEILHWFNNNFPRFIASVLMTFPLPPVCFSAGSWIFLQLHDILALLKDYLCSKLTKCWVFKMNVHIKNNSPSKKPAHAKKKESSRNSLYLKGVCPVLYSFFTIHAEVHVWTQSEHLNIHKAILTAGLWADSLVPSRHHCSC